MKKLFSRKHGNETTSKSEEQHGMFVFADKNEFAQGIIDIIAIHGLNGHYRDTWTAATGSNWLETEDFLPAQIPNARILSYGYNSTVQFSKSEADIGVFAEQLLESVMLYRRTNVEQSRPVVFLCHSLGGIVFKKAIIRAHERSNRFSSLLSLIRGVVFFGTPHNGSSIAVWTSMFANILKASSLGTSTNSRLSEDLEAHSNVLWQISKSFVERGKDLRIYSFYELDKMDFMNCRVVDEHSAVLNLPNEVTFPLNGNHSTICKFLKPSEKRYELVWKNLADLVQFALAGVDTDISGGLTPNLPPQCDAIEPELVECHQVFRTSDYEGNKNRNPDRISGTCKWFLDSPNFSSWQENSFDIVLVVFADPGCGKSVLSKALIDEPLLIDDFSLIKLFFFFREDDETSGSFSVAISAILHQILTRFPKLVTYCLPDFRANGKKLPLLPDRLWDILITICKSNSMLRIICILDALDECEKSQSHLIARYLRSLYGKDRVTNLKFIITSRWSDDIERHLPYAASKVFLSGSETSEGIIHEEINTVIKQEVRTISKEIRLDVVSTQMLEKHLIDMDNRSYLWLYLTLDMLRKSVGITTAKRLKTFLSEIPNTVEEAYERILTRNVSDASIAKKLLHIVVAAFCPLTIADMRTAMSICSDSTTWDDIDLEEIENFTKTIRNACGLFIRIVQGKVYLLHQTAKKFLQRLEEKKPNNEINLRINHRWKHSLNIYESHHILAFVCINYLNLSTFEEKHHERAKSSSKRDKHKTSVASSIPSHVFRECHSGGQRIIREGRRIANDPSHLTLEDFFSMQHFRDYAAKHWLLHYEVGKKRISQQNLLAHSLQICKTAKPQITSWFQTFALKNTDPPAYPFLIEKILSRLGEEGDLALCGYIGHADGVAWHMTRKNTPYFSRPTFLQTQYGLVRAIETGNLPVLKVILERPLAPYTFHDLALSRELLIDRLGLLELAIYYRQVPIIYWLLKNGASSNLNCKYGFTSKSLSQEPIQLLLEADIEGFLCSRQISESSYAISAGQPILHFAVKSSSVDEVLGVIRMLLKYGANSKAVDNIGHSASRVAIEASFDNPDTADIYNKVANEIASYEITHPPSYECHIPNSPQRKETEEIKGERKREKKIEKEREEETLEEIWEETKKEAMKIHLNSNLLHEGREKIRALSINSRDSSMSSLTSRNSSMSSLNPIPE